MNGMVKSLLPIITSTALGVTFFGCGDDSTTLYDSGPNNGRVVGSVNGRVIDGVTGAIISGAVVSYADDSGIHSTTTNANGYYLINGLETGDYVISVAPGTGFSAMSMDVSIPSLAEIGIDNIPTESDFHQSVARDIEVYPLTSAIEGTLYEYINNGELLPGSQVQVVVDYSNANLMPAIYTAVTDDSGNFSLSNLPSSQTATLRVWPFQDGEFAFANYQATIGLFPGSTVLIDNIIVTTVQSAPFIVSDNFSQGLFNIGNNINITFNKAMAVEDFTVVLQGQGLAEVELGALEWSEDRKTVTINPDEELRLERIYELQIAGRAQDNSACLLSRTFMTQDGIAVSTTSLQPYDGSYIIGENDSIVIRYTEEVDITDPRNVYMINGNTVDVTFQDNNHTLVIPAPNDGYSGVQISLNVVAYSTLADYDNVVLSRSVSIQQ